LSTATLVHQITAMWRNMQRHVKNKTNKNRKCHHDWVWPCPKWHTSYALTVLWTYNGCRVHL